MLQTANYTICNGSEINTSAKPNNNLTNQALDVLQYHYLNDDRPFCVAFSGGKDSTAVLYLIFGMIARLKLIDAALHKKIYIINSNTLAELPPILKHLKATLKQICRTAKSQQVPIEVIEVFPELKNTLNVQLLGVGMPPPTTMFRWCTDKLKVAPIDYKLKNIFPDGRFISIIGTRKDESIDRANRIKNLTINGTNLKLNDRYKNANNLMPIEDWSTKDVWSFLFEQNNSLVNIDFLWKLYSDASNKEAKECLFVGAGGKEIEEGKIGCGISRFGCWQCYMVRDNDKSLDGLLKSGHKQIELYKDYRNWYWQITQQGWEKTRDPYSHKHHGQELYNKGNKSESKFGMTMPKGITLKIRQEALKKILELQSKLDEIIITKGEIIEIQKRWIYEGDLELTAFKEARKYNHSLNIKSLDTATIDHIKSSKQYYREKLNNNGMKKLFSTKTLKRFAVQSIVNSKTIKNKFFPSKFQEKHIRQEWRLQKKIPHNTIFANIFELI